MIVRPDIIARRAIVQQRMGGILGARLALRRPRHRRDWPWRSDTEILVTWSGERSPYPTLDVAGSGRRALVVGHAVNGATQIDTWAGITFSDGVHHFAVLQVGCGGMITPINPLEIVTRVKHGGQWVADPPNPPSLIGVQRLSGNRPRVSWCHSRVAEQGQVTEFRVYASSGSPFDFGDEVATVAYRNGRTRYEWIGDALEVGDVRWYTVRAASAFGVLSLIPRRNMPPSGDYDDVGLEWCPRLEIPVPPASDAGDVMAEALRVQG